LLEVIRQSDIALLGMGGALEEINVFHFAHLMKQRRVEPKKITGSQDIIRESDCPPSLRFGGHQPSLKLRLVSRSFSEG